MKLSTQTEQETPTETIAELIADPRGDRTWYDVLEVSPRASKSVIQAAYRALARSAHPDLNHYASAAERMRELNRARDVLLDPRRRAIYDLNIGQQKTARLNDGRGTSVRRAHTCWQCKQPLSAYVAYCGRCRWLVCEACESCGCTHPDWKAPPSTERVSAEHPLLRRVGPLTRLGWLVVAVCLALVSGGVWAVALR